jgi:hypothetical protein
LPTHCEKQRRAGIMTVLVSGRILPDIELLLPSRDLFDAIVAESGAVVQMANGASPTVLARGPDAAPAERGRSGLPHWIVVDEAHYFFGAGGASSADAVVQTGNTVLVTYRPSLIAPDLLDSIGAFILTQTTVEQERYFVDALLRARGPAELDVSAALRALESPRGGSCRATTADPGGRPSCRGPACPRTRFAPGETRPSNCRPRRNSSSAFPMTGP